MIRPHIAGVSLHCPRCKEERMEHRRRITPPPFDAEDSGLPEPAPDEIELWLANVQRVQANRRPRAPQDRSSFEDSNVIRLVPFDELQRQLGIERAQDHPALKDLPAWLQPEHGDGTEGLDGRPADLQ